MRVIDQLVDHFRWSELWSEELEEQLCAVGLLTHDLDWEDEGCEGCRHWICVCEAILEGGYEPAESDYDLLARCETLDAARRKRISYRIRGRRGRRREATVDVVRKAAARLLDKWMLSGGRLDHLKQVGALLNCRGGWRRAARTMLAHPVPRLVSELSNIERHSVRPLFNQLHDLDLAWQSFARPWRGQAGAALRRLVEQRPDKRSHKLLRHSEFRDVQLQVELASHLKLARKFCYEQRWPARKPRVSEVSAN